MTNTVYDLAVAHCCQNCVIIMTNGDASGLSEEEYATWAEGVDSVSLARDGWEWSGVQCDSWVEDGVRCDCDGDEHVNEGWFSWSPCEWCNDAHGGTRFNVAIMRKII